MPAHSSALVLLPKKRPNTRVNSGTVATANAATPEATPQCSATVTPPLPQLSSRMPMAPADKHCLRLGSGAPRQSIQANRIAPAMMKRQPAISIGGQDSTPIRMTR